jgi:arabinogalactan endo-1,4-beta-galactosidase
LQNRKLKNLLLLVLAGSIAPLRLISADPEFIKGADASFIPQIEDVGGIYKDNGIPQDPLLIFKNHGMNAIRLKLWHTPEEPYNNLEKVLEMAYRIKSMDLKFILDIHYSDTWADPGKQYKPAAWYGLPFETLRDSVRQYTERVIRALGDQGTLPDMVQIGNEITSGMLWNDGRVGGTFTEYVQWENLGKLIKSAVRGVRDAGAESDSIRIILHIDRGADNAGTRWFFDHMLGLNVPFDVIGLSYYPWWHGSLSEVEHNLNDLAVRYGRDILIAETAYPWTLQWFDPVHNMVSSSNDLLPGYPASVNGQAAFLDEMIRIVRGSPNKHGIGILYWAPEHISVEPIGSPWENNALFDFHGNTLSSMDVFLEQPADTASVQVTIRLNTCTLQDTLGETGIVQIRGGLGENPSGLLPDGRKVSWESDSEIFLRNTGGDYWEASFRMSAGDSLSYKFWTGFSISRPTFQRLGWEGPVIPYGHSSGNGRILVAGEKDTVVRLQYYNSTSAAKLQYWRPFENHPDSIALYFRVNMTKAMESGWFDAAVNGPVAVRGDSIFSGRRLDQEQYSVNSASFWSGVCYIPQSGLSAGSVLEYKYFVENSIGNRLEGGGNRSLVFTESLLARGDTTLHWDYFRIPDGCCLTVTADHGPSGFDLLSNTPNPFNGETRIVYRLGRPSRVRLDVHDLYGRRVAVLVNENQPAGPHSIVWNAEKTEGLLPASGVYFIRIQTDEGMRTIKALFMK